MFQILSYLTDNINVVISILVTAFGFWQVQRKRSMEKKAADEIDILIEKMANALYYIQSARDTQSLAYFMGAIGNAEGRIDASLVHTIKIYCELKQTTIDDVNRLIEHFPNYGQYKHHFYRFSQPKLGFLCKIVKKLL